ncbi:hypothetical protein HDK64DRAFT_282585 [Phyllosticta capitalensis]
MGYRDIFFSFFLSCCCWLVGAKARPWDGMGVLWCGGVVERLFFSVFFFFFFIFFFDTDRSIPFEFNTAGFFLRPLLSLSPSLRPSFSVAAHLFPIRYHPGGG